MSKGWVLAVDIGGRELNILEANNGVKASMREKKCAISKNIDSLLPVIYDDLKRLARIQRQRVYAKNNLGTRSIVHQAYINISKSNTEIKDKNQLLFLASTAMRNIIIDNARAWSSKKRGENNLDISIDQISLVSVQRNADILALDEALKDLKTHKKRLVDVVTCRFFGGLTQEETSAALDISVATIKRDWTLAKTLLFQRLSA
jgi:RNA polymerase sigma factor (TIGR02999 family)